MYGLDRTLNAQHDNQNESTQLTTLYKKYLICREKRYAGHARNTIKIK